MDVITKSLNLPAPKATGLVEESYYYYYYYVKEKSRQTRDRPI